MSYNKCCVLDFRVNIDSLTNIQLKLSSRTHTNRVSHIGYIHTCIGEAQLIGMQLIVQCSVTVNIET